MQYQLINNEPKNTPDYDLGRPLTYKVLSLTLAMLLSNAGLAVGQVLPPDPGKIGTPLPRLDAPNLPSPDIKKDKSAAVGQRADTE